VQQLNIKPAAAFSTSCKKLSAHDPHAEESFEEFSARYGTLICT
jgi:hypothetical protein